MDKSYGVFHEVTGHCALFDVDEDTADEYARKANKLYLDGGPWYVDELVASDFNFKDKR